MTKRKYLSVLFLALLAAFPAQAAKIKINKGALKNVKKVAIVSLTLTNISDENPVNVNFISQAVGYALETYRREIAGLKEWQLVNPPDLKALDRELADLATSQTALDVLVKMSMELAQADTLPEEFDSSLLADLSNASAKGRKEILEELKSQALGETIKRLQQDLNTMRGRLVWPKELAGIPFGLVNKQKKVKKSTSVLRDMVDQLLRNYSKRHGLDGVLVVFLWSEIDKPTGIRVITRENRVLATFKVSPALVLRTAEGSVAIDTGESRIDDLARVKVAMPIYIGEKRPESGGVTNIRLHLPGPGGKAMVEYKNLIDKTAAGLTDILKKKLP